MSDMKIVTFKKEWRGYAIGETAGFPTDEATVLIESGRAKAYSEKTPADSSPKAPASKKNPAKKGGSAPAGPKDKNPVDPVDPIGTVDQVDPVDPADLVEPVDPVDADEPDEEKP